MRKDDVILTRSLMAPSESKQKLRNELKSDTEAFLARGGVIEELSNGFTEQSISPGPRGFNGVHGV